MRALTGRRRCVSITLLLGAVLALPACGSEAPAGPSTIDATDSVPSDSLQDWVSYADHVSIVRVERERPTETSVDPDINGGYLGRILTLRVVETLWRRPGATAPPPCLEMVVAGWMGSDRRPATVAGGLRPEVGGSYLVPLARYERTNQAGGWGPLGGRVLMPWKSGKADAPPEQVAATAALRAKDAAQIRTLLARAKADPLAVKHARLGPEARFQAVSAERASSATTTP